MTLDDAAREAIEQLAGTHKIDRLGLIFGTVKSVELDTNTCVVTPFNSRFVSDIPGVLLQADVSDGVEFIPTIDSTVMVMWSLQNSPYVAMYSELENINMSCNDVIKLQDGSFGGLTKTQELKTQLDKTNAVLQAVVDSLSSWTPVPSDGGAALKAFFVAAVAGKTKGDYSDIENEKVTHGI
jgi:hypothetical protein